MPDTPRSFVFHDPTGKRWRRFRRSLQTAAIFFGILLVLFVLSMAISPQIPALGLPPVERRLDQPPFTIPTSSGSLKSELARASHP